MAIISLKGKDDQPDALARTKQKQLPKVKPMVDVFASLSTLTWKDQQLPCKKLSYSFQQEFSPHRYLFRDEALIQSLRRDNQHFRYVIPFRQGIVNIKYINAFSDMFPVFLQNCFSRDAGDLIDPVLGLFNAKVIQFSYDLEASQGRDGIDVEVEFISVPNEDGSGITPAPSVSVASTDAGVLDRATAVVDWEDQELPEPSQDLLNQASGLVDQVTFNINKVTASLSKVMFQADKVITSINHLTNPTKYWGVKQLAYQSKATAADAKATLGGKNQLPRTYQVPRNTTLSALCGVLKSSQQDLLKLNPRLASSPKVRAGTTVTYFESK